MHSAIEVYAMAYIMNLIDIDHSWIACHTQSSLLPIQEFIYLFIAYIYY